MSTNIIENEYPYLTFVLGEELFAVNVSKVLEILELRNITKVPKSPDYMRGVMNLRGSVLPIIDARMKFGMERIEDTVDTCILVLSIKIGKDQITVGALADGVREVINIPQESIQPPPSLGANYKSEFIEGMGKVNEDFIMILNIDKVMSAEELVMVQESTHQTPNGDKKKSKANAVTKG